MISLAVYILITMLFSAFFSGMEIAFVSSNRMLMEVERSERKEEKGEKQDLTTRVIEFFYRRPNEFVSTMLVGNNIALVIYGILIARLFDGTIFLNIDPGFTVPADTIISTIIVLFTGEFLPKLLFKSAPNWFLSVFALPTFLFYVLLWPISRFATLLSRLLLACVGVKVRKEEREEEFSKVDLDYLVQSSIDGVEDESKLDTEVKIFQNALEFSDTTVKDCMIPRTEVDAVDIKDCSLDELRQKFVESGHSRVIVYEDDIDHIVGYVHSSEMFRDAENWRRHVLKMPFVPETMKAHKLMKMLMQQKKSLGVVVDEYGGTGGIVSLEDIVEEIFGEIEDEHDSSDLLANRISENEYDISARMEIDRINELFDLDLPENNDEYQTLAGLILYNYKSFPKLNELVRIGRFEFKILKKSNTKLELVRVKTLS